MSESDAKLLNAAARHAFQDALRHKRTRQGRFDAAMLHFGHPLSGGGRMLEPNDGGAGAERIYADVEELPLWEKLYMHERKALKPRHRAVLDALAIDLRPRVAARIAGVGKDLVYHCLGKIFKVRFTQCFQAYAALFND